MNKKEQRKRQAWTAQTVLEEIDAFGEPIPVFNVRGKTSVQTHIGGVVTILIAIVVLVYATV